MPLLIIDTPAITPQPWRNGGGQTRELWAWPAHSGGAASADWQVRISRAAMVKDGVFSAFPGVQRWYTVAEGAGARLHLPDGTRTVRPGDAPCCFDGQHTPACELLDGPTENLNIMAQGGGKAYMQVAQPNEPWQARWAMRGLYTNVAGTWSNGEQTQAVNAYSLLWHAEADAGAWQFTPLAGNKGWAWWLGFEPAA